MGVKGDFYYIAVLISQILIGTLINSITMYKTYKVLQSILTRIVTYKQILILITKGAFKYNGINTTISSFLFLNPGIPVEDRVNIFINSFGSIQETTMVRIHFNSTSA